MYFNNIGNCSYKSGHFSQDGKFARLHICRICFNNSGSGVKKFHSAMDCKYRESNKLVKDSRERFSNDEKPCSFFNNTGNCRLASGHNSKSGSTKQMHICSCCLEFHHEVKFHSAFSCELKKKLTGGRKELFSASPSFAWWRSATGNVLPCHSYNAGKCILRDGHCTSLGTKLLHICKFCLEFRGEKNFHTSEECELKKILLKEVKSDSQNWKNERKESKSANDKEKRDKIISKKMAQQENGREERKPKENIDKKDAGAEIKSPSKQNNAKMLHICKFCLEFRGEKNFHTSEECEVKKSLLLDVESRTQNLNVKKMAKKENGCEEPKKDAGSEKITPSKQNRCKRLEKVVSHVKVSLIKRKALGVLKKRSPVVPVSDEDLLIHQAAKDDGHFYKENINKMEEDVPNHSEDKFLDETEQEVNVIFASPLKQTKSDQIEMVFNNDDHTKIIVKNKETENELGSDYQPFLKRKPDKQNGGDIAGSGKKQRKLERSIPSQSNTLSIKGKDLNDEGNPLPKNLLPVDKVLENLNSKAGNSHSDPDEDKILKKIKNLEKLYALEMQKLRHARKHMGGSQTVELGQSQEKVEPNQQ